VEIRSPALNYLGRDLVTSVFGGDNNFRFLVIEEVRMLMAIKHSIAISL
jgi:hypothetical protein